MFIKNEAQNPTGSVSDRGSSVAISAAKQLGIKNIIAKLPAAGAVSLAAYASAAGIRCHLYIPKGVESVASNDCKLYGAEIVDSAGPINEYERIVSGNTKQEGWIDFSSLDSFRLEGEKTIAYEILEALGWILPQAVIFGASERTLPVAMWKAFDEIEQLGLIDQQRPRIFVAEASSDLNENNDPPGLDVDDLVRDILPNSKGGSVAITDLEATEARRDWARFEGLLVGKQGAVAIAAYRKLPSMRLLDKDASVVLINSDSAWEDCDVAAPGTPPASRHIAGIIGPY